MYKIIRCFLTDTKQSGRFYLDRHTIIRWFQDPNNQVFSRQTKNNQVFSRQTHNNQVFSRQTHNNQVVSRQTHNNRVDSRQTQYDQVVYRQTHNNQVVSTRQTSWTNMSMDLQTSTLCRSTHFHLRKIASIRPYLSISSTAQLVSSLILSRLDYCNSTFSGLPSSSLNRLQKVQKTTPHGLFSAKENQIM